MAVSQVTETATKVAAGLLQHAQGMRDATQLSGQSRWYRPLDWTGNVTDVEALGEGFNREELYGMFRGAVGGGAQGTTGDLMAITVQGDFIAAAERAFRQRHCSSVRAKMHASGRHRGHGDPSGPINNGQGNYLKQLVQLANG